MSATNTKQQHDMLMRFRTALLEALKWPHAPSETPAAYRTLWVLLVWWRERPDALRSAFYAAFTRMYQADRTRVWHAIPVDEWLRMLLDAELARFGHALDKEERQPTRVKLPPFTEITPLARVQLDALYQARQNLVMTLPEPWLPERFPTAHDPEELVTLHAMLQCPLCNVEWMTSVSTLRVVCLLGAADDQRAFWVQTTRALYASQAKGFAHVSHDAAPSETAIALAAQKEAPIQAPQTCFPGLLETESEAFREGALSVPAYARAWLLLLHFAYESLGFAYDAKKEPRQALFDELDTLRAALVKTSDQQHKQHLRDALQPWLDLVSLGSLDEVGAFWDELARYMQAVLAAFAREALWQRDTAGLCEFILSL